MSPNSGEYRNRNGAAMAAKNKEVFFQITDFVDIVLKIDDPMTCLDHTNGKRCQLRDIQLNEVMKTSIVRAATRATNGGRIGDCAAEYLTDIWLFIR